MGTQGLIFRRAKKHHFSACDDDYSEYDYGDSAEGLTSSLNCIDTNAFCSPKFCSSWSKAQTECVKTCDPRCRKPLTTKKPKVFLVTEFLSFNDRKKKVAQEYRLQDRRRPQDRQDTALRKPLAQILRFQKTRLVRTTQRTAHFVETL